MVYCLHGRSQLSVGIVTAVSVRPCVSAESKTLPWTTWFALVVSVTVAQDYGLLCARQESTQCWDSYCSFSTSLCLCRVLDTSTHHLNCFSYVDNCCSGLWSSVCTAGIKSVLGQLLQFLYVRVSSVLKDVYKRQVNSVLA